MNDREKERNELLELLKTKIIRHSRIKNLLQDIERGINDIKSKFNDLDYKLAMENRTIIPSSQKTSKPREVKKFTLDEIKSIAVKLGVEITVKEENET